MLARLTARNRLTIPKEIADRFKGVEYFDVLEEEGRIVLVPFRRSRGEEVRHRLEAYGISEDNVQDAVSWARSTGYPPTSAHHLSDTTARTSAANTR